MKTFPASIAACPDCNPKEYANAPLQLVQCPVCGYGGDSYLSEDDSDGQS